MIVVQGGKAVDRVDSQGLGQQGPDPRLDREAACVTRAQLGHAVGDVVKSTADPKSMARKVGCYAAVIYLDDNF